MNTDRDDILALVASSVHDMKAPLTTIGGFIEAVLDGTAKADEARHCLEAALSEVERLRGMTADLLDASRLCAGKAGADNAPINICDTASRALLALEGRINEKDLLPDVCFDAENITVTADDALIFRALYNILENAVKFSPEHGRIELSAKRLEDGAEISVTNEGSSIDEDELSRVFEPFYRSKRARTTDGSGLGLYIVSMIAEAHDGSVRAESGRNTEGKEYCRIIFRIGNGK